MANITLHFPDNFGGDATQIYYIGLKGEATQVLAPQVLSPLFFLGFSSLFIPAAYPDKTIISQFFAAEEGCCCNHRL